MLKNIFGGLNSIEKGLLSSIQNLSVNGEIQGRKKLMKLMFFLEHYDFNLNSLTPEHKFCSNDFMIYKYGPFSFDVMNTLEHLEDDGYIEEKNIGYPNPISIKLTEKGKVELEKNKPNLNDIQKNQLSMVKRYFSSKSGYDLEIQSLKELNISKEEKNEYIGLPISVLLSEEE